MTLGRILCRIAAAWAAALLALAWSIAAPAETPHLDLPANLTAVIDFRLVLTDGEQSWTDGGFGKSRFGNRDGAGTEAHARIANAELAWHGPIAWNVDGTVAAAFQDGQDQPVDLIQAYATWRPTPHGATRFSVRAGLYWPEISLEHSGPAWQVSDMITPSAINSWVGEEVKVLGLEGSASHPLGGGHVTATLGVFGFNDTAGTLLSFRGWALHDQQTGAFSRDPLPPLNMFMGSVQPPFTTPTVEVDHRAGFYGRIAWDMAAPVSLQAFYYRNRGDPEATTSSFQWGWDTSFLNLGARIELTPHTHLLAQALSGSTRMGLEENEVYWVETRFRAAYLRLTQELGRFALSGRLDLFDTRQRGSELLADDNEQGWALTGAADYHLTRQAQLLIEWLHISSDRDARARLGLDPNQVQNVVQAAMRLSL